MDRAYSLGITIASRFGARVGAIRCVTEGSDRNFNVEIRDRVLNSLRYGAKLASSQASSPTPLLPIHPILPPLPADYSGIQLEPQKYRLAFRR